MKRFLIALLFLALAIPSHAQEWQEARMTLPMLSGTLAAPPAGGWIYSCAGTDTYAQTDSDNAGVQLSGKITLASGGTITKFAWKSPDTDAVNVKMNLYVDAASQSPLVTSCITTSGDAGWRECTLETPYVAAAGDYQIAFDNDATAHRCINSGYNGYFQTGVAYADFPAHPYNKNTASSDCPAVRAWVQ